MNAVTDAATELLPAALAIEAIEGKGDELAMTGSLDIRSLSRADELLKKWRGRSRRRAMDLSGVGTLDTSGAKWLCELRDNDVTLNGVQPAHQALLDLVCGLDVKPVPKKRPVARWRAAIIALGKIFEEAVHDVYDVIVFVGRATSAIAQSLLHPSALRLPAISRQIAETGVRALPIVGLLAIMISIVIAYQGVAQLRPYGGEDLTVDLVAVSVLREMGVLITAILVAGRSGSAFTAEIGVMKAREEIDALRVMGLDPMALLVVPRLIGLLITLPLLTFFADIMGLAGGAAIGKVLLGIEPLQYLEQVRKAVDGSDLFVGLLKAPVFAFVIGVVSCMHGLRVHGSAESVGKETTRAVVKAIFWVIVLDAIFSILFDKLGL